MLFVAGLAKTRFLLCFCFDQDYQDTRQEGRGVLHGENGGLKEKACCHLLCSTR